MKLKKISLDDKAVFNKYLGLERHELACFAFENIYIWKALFNIEWSIIKDSLCVFFSDKFGSFLYLPPLSVKNNPAAVARVFEILRKSNKIKDMCRIENIEETDLSFYEALGYDCKYKSYDYLCLSTSLANLPGDKFKSKRASHNYFVKHYTFEYLPFSSKEKARCLKLYDHWMCQRKGQSQDKIYLGMLEDSRRSFKEMLDSYSGLNLTGRIVKMGEEIKGMTFGFKLNSDTFCILYEMTDLSVKGLAQFIFAQFSKDLQEYKYINIMDDSGLENLKKVKLSYHPVKFIPAYIANIKNEPRTF